MQYPVNKGDPRLRGDDRILHRDDYARTQSVEQKVSFPGMSAAQKRAFLLARRARQLGQPVPEDIQPALSGLGVVERQTTALPFRSGTDLNLKALVQLRNSYIIAHDPDGLVILDQHAAHERVQYMKLMQGLEHEQVVQQQLLTPFQLELSYNEAILFEQELANMKQIGFDVEPFGQRTFSINAIPACIGKDNLAEILRGVVDDIREERPVSEISRREEKVLTYIACRSAVMFGKALSLAEMDELLRQLDGLTQKFTCPHGRPTMIKMPYEELERRFGRR